MQKNIVLLKKVKIEQNAFVFTVYPSSETIIEYSIIISNITQGQGQ